MALPNQPTVGYPSFKLLIVGDAGTGKTTFLLRYKEAQSRFDSNIPVEVHMIDLTTNRGKIRLDCWDIGKGPSLYYANAQCAIIMFDVTSRLTYENVPIWYKELSKVCGDIPIVVCGNKVDMKKRQVKMKEITFHRMKNLKYYEMSARANYHVQEPLFYLAQELHGMFKLVKYPVLPPPEVGMANWPAQWR